MRMILRHEGGTDLLTAVQTAASLPGVSVVSMSFGVSDSLEQLWRSRFLAPANSRAWPP